MNNGTVVVVVVVVVVGALVAYFMLRSAPNGPLSVGSLASFMPKTPSRSGTASNENTSSSSELASSTSEEGAT